MSGYVRIHRSLIGHPAFRNDAEAMAFAWMVAKAAWKPIRVRYKERGIHLRRGQLAISQRDMAKALDRDKAWVERLWKRLRGEAMIAVDSEAGVAVITICKYAQYQAEKQSREAAGEAPCEADARQGQGTEQEREEGKEVSSGSKEPSPRAKFPAPDGVSDEQWVAFRQQRKKPINERSYTLLGNKLRDLAEAGYPPGEMIDLAIERGWETVFEPKDQRNGQSSSNITSLRGHRPDPALDLVRAASAAEDRENRWGAGSSVPAIGSG